MTLVIIDFVFVILDITLFIFSFSKYSNWLAVELSSLQFVAWNLCQCGTITLPRQPWVLGLGGESLRWIRVLAACSCTAVQGCSTVLQCCSTGYSLQCNNGSSDLNTSLLLVTFYILLSNTLRVGSPNCCPHVQV